MCSMNFIENLPKFRKWPYLAQMAKKERKNGPLFSSTLKVEESRVPSFSLMLAC